MNDYIPEPKPQFGPIEVTALYYPGTEQMAEWDQVAQTLPHIKPLLGWYDEGNPEVVDWQIKWAVEHGISNFCVDWYWNKGVMRLDHWVNAYYRARYRNYLKWFMMYANHNEPNAHSTQDQINITRFWIENYFRTSEYYTIDGHPVVVYWNLHNLDNDFINEAAAKGEHLQSGEGIRRAFDITNKMMREAGLPDVLFIGMYHSSVYDQKEIDWAKSIGCKALMGYNFGLNAYQIAPEAAKADDVYDRFNFDCVVKALPKWWQMTVKDTSIPFWPLLPTGWNDKPRSFQYARMIYDRTPAKFSELCRSCRDFCEQSGSRHVVVAPLNEWQEGSYIEPNEEYGFQMYDALRDAFCDKPHEGFPPNLVPSDIGRGPYDYPPMPHLAKTSWDFSLGTEGWYRNPFGTAYVKIVDGCLHFFRNGVTLPALRTRIAPFDATKFTSFRIMMKVTPCPDHPMNGDSRIKGERTLALLWGSENSPLILPNNSFTQENVASMETTPDGEWHEYTISLASNPRWKGMINELWLDVPKLALGYFDISWMRLE
ncbi:MAG: glycoside hydrolase family 99-like domain-containing protein [Victivallales bacterium]|nr:glycoside hydrolase family 99-like domain-containing protein [Victivallales bacterium]